VGKVSARWRGANGFAVEASFLKTFTSLGGAGRLGCAITPGLFAGDTLQQYFNHGRLDVPGRSGPFKVGVPRLVDLGSSMARAVLAPAPVGVEGSFADPWADETRRAFAGDLIGGSVEWREWHIQFYEREVVRLLERSPGELRPYPGHAGDIFVSLRSDQRERGEGREAPVKRPDVAALADVHVPILTYHLTRGADLFRSQLLGLIEGGLVPVSFEQVVAAVEGWAEVPAKAFVVSFDDGWSAQLDDALQVLEELRIPSIFFVLPGFHRYQQGHMSVSDFRVLRAAGATVASHTLNHADLTDLIRGNIGAAQAEVVESREQLESAVDGVDFFAYPLGIFDRDSRRLVQDAGYRAAVTTQIGIVHRQSRLFEMRRIGVQAWWSTGEVVRAIRLAARMDGVEPPI
jgi:peptidoglycan/xylan/chitin deacetylase (PgdA/CDA1 family)